MQGAALWCEALRHFYKKENWNTDCGTGLHIQWRNFSRITTRPLSTMSIMGMLNVVSASRDARICWVDCYQCLVLTTWPDHYAMRATGPTFVLTISIKLIMISNHALFFLMSSLIGKHECGDRGSVKLTKNYGRRDRKTWSLSPECQWWVSY